MVPEVSLVSEYAVAVLPVSDVTVDQVMPPSVDLSIWYPVITEPPLLDGVAQDRLICDDETGEAASPVGGCGAVIGVLVVADTTLEGELVPIPLIA